MSVDLDRLIKLSWLVVQLLLLPNAIHQNTMVLNYSGYALIALILIIYLS
ncbi:hypothetical protein [Lactiplantibacillus xiangfangensis]|nr:hypothetical protein [Lactiplantibacillus xiangfangensis]